MLSTARAKVTSGAQEIALSTNNCVNSYINKPISKKWAHKPWQSTSVPAEPTSVLDIGSLSPSSTPSSSLVGSEGQLGLTENNTVAVSGIRKAFQVSQLTDCITSSNLDATTVWTNSNSHELCENLDTTGHGLCEDWTVEVGGISTSQFGNSVCDRVGLTKIEEVKAEMRNDGNCLVSEASGHCSNLSLIHGKGRHIEMEKAYQAGEFSSPMMRDVNVDAQGENMKIGKILKEALVKGRLEASVMQCLRSSKGGQGDFLEEVVQKLTGKENRKGEEDWLASDCNEFSPPMVAISSSLDNLHKVVPAAASHGWLMQSYNGSPLTYQQAALPAQISCSAVIAAGGVSFVSDCNAKNSVSPATPKFQQLDLYEAMQSCLLYNSNDKVWCNSSTNGSPSDNPGSMHRCQQPHIPSPPPAFSPISHLGHCAPIAPCPSYPLDEVQVPSSVVFPPPRYHSLPFCSSPPRVSHRALSPPSARGSSSELLTLPLPFTIPNLPDTNCSTYPSSGIHPMLSASELKPLQVCPMDVEGMLVNDGLPKWQAREGMHPAGWIAGLAADEAAGRALPFVPCALLQSLSEHQMTSMLHMVGSRIRSEDLMLAQRSLSDAMDALHQGNRALAQAILARLNNISSAKGQPMERAIFYFKEALTEQAALGYAGCSFPRQHQSHLLCQEMGRRKPIDVISKINAYKNFCEVSVIPQFAHFTSNQVIMNAMDDEQCVHIIDFELGLGGQWASFMQEISQRSTGPPDFLKITTIGVPDSVEMQLAKENLVSFASELGLSLLIDVLPVPGLGCLKAFMVSKGERDAVAVNFGFGMCRVLSDFTSMDSLLGFLQFIKSLSPKIVTIVDSEFGHVGSSRQMDSLQFYSCIFESLECLGLAKETVLHIEALLFAPKIAALVQGRSPLNSLNSLPPWRILFQNAGFTLMKPSNVAEMQLQCLIKNPLHKGFCVRKQEGNLYLFWIDQPLLAASSWVC